jgi:2-iminobutanoate/2-iminopropanoate deaminase
MDNISNPSSGAETSSRTSFPSRTLVRTQHERSNTMKREIIRVEPIATLLEKYKAPTSTVVRHGDTLYLTGCPPFDKNGEIIKGPGTIKAQTEAVLEQIKLMLETAGSSLDNVLKCNIYCTSVDLFTDVNEVYHKYFPKDWPARIFISVPAWNGGFDIEIDCIAAV